VIKKSDIGEMVSSDSTATNWYVDNSKGNSSPYYFDPSQKKTSVGAQTKYGSFMWDNPYFEGGVGVQIHNSHKDPTWVGYQNVVTFDAYAVRKDTGQIKQHFRWTATSSQVLSAAADGAGNRNDPQFDIHHSLRILGLGIDQSDLDLQNTVLKAYGMTIWQ
jgi:hypothetical protein